MSIRDQLDAAQRRLSQIPPAYRATVTRPRGARPVAHHRDQCKHGVLVSQCRCIGPKQTRIVACPPHCKGTGPDAVIDRCGASHPQLPDDNLCREPKGHEGPHMTHDSQGRPEYTWTGDVAILPPCDLDMPHHLAREIPPTAPFDEHGCPTCCPRRVERERRASA